MTAAERSWQQEIEARAAGVRRAIPDAEQRLIAQLAHEVRLRVVAEVDYRSERLRAGYWRLLAFALILAWFLRESLHA